MDLPIVMAGVVAFAVFLYVVMDGFDLGIGILFPLFPRRGDRDVMMTSVAPVWDGNETWLILGGGGLFAAFPLAYSVVMPALYAPIVAMLLGLVFRGVAFEFRWRTERGRVLWDMAFAGGSAVAAFAQGVALGALLQGVRIEGRSYAGGWFDWATPFSLMTGLAVVTGYALLGATWLVMKSEGDLRSRCVALSRLLLVATLGFVAAVSLATPFLFETYRANWLAWPRVLVTAPVPLLVALLALGTWRALGRQAGWRRDGWPFVLTLALFGLCFVGLGVSVFPDIVPPSLSIRDAAAPEASLRFILVGVSVLIPIILVYTAYAYWVFRGKVDPSAGYH